MGNSTRCPKCNKWGNPSLDNYCKVCDLDNFKDDLLAVCNGSRKVLFMALAEFGTDLVQEIRREDRPKVINIIKRRQQIKRRNHLEQSSAPLESYGYGFFSEPKDFSIEKGVTDIEY